MKKIFSFILVVLMVIGIGVSVLNITSANLEAKVTEEKLGWYFWPGLPCTDLIAVDCYIITVTPEN